MLTIKFRQFYQNLISLYLSFANNNPSTIIDYQFSSAYIYLLYFPFLVYYCIFPFKEDTEKVRKNYVIISKTNGIDDIYSLTLSTS